MSSFKDDQYDDIGIMDHHIDDDKNEEHELETPSTLLPSPLAGAVTVVTRSSALYLRFGAFIGGLALDGARISTLTGLELSRALIEGMLIRAGSDVALRAKGELGTPATPAREYM